MNIHTASYGESLFDIARKYSVMPTKILEDNDLACDTLSDGEELLILKPTRCVTTAGGDTISSICQRFGVRRDLLIRNNPSLALTESLRPGKSLGVKYDVPPFGTGAALGFYKKTTSREKFKRTLPYLTYVVFESLHATREGVFQVFSEGEALIDMGGRISLVGISDEGDFPLEFSLIDRIIEYARGKFGGIYLSFAKCRRENMRELSDFLLEARRRLIGCDLLMFFALENDTDSSLSEICDGAVLMNENEKVAEVFAKDAESGRIFVFIDSFAKEGERKFEIKDAIRLARRAGAKIKTDEKTLVSSFEIKRYIGGAMKNSRISFPSLFRVKESFKTLSSLGYIGFAFDIQSVPIPYLCMFNALFARADYLLP